MSQNNFNLNNIYLNNKIHQSPITPLQYYKNNNIQMNKRKTSPNNLYSKYYIFNKDFKNNIKQNTNLYNYYNNLTNNIISNKDLYPKKIIRYNRSIDQDLDMMKMQLRCDLITQKIYQIQDQVQNLHESSIKDDLNLLNKTKNTIIEDINDIGSYNDNSLSNRIKYNIINKAQLTKQYEKYYRNNKDEMLYINEELNNNYYNYEINEYNNKNYKTNNSKNDNQKLYLLNSNNKNISGLFTYSNEIVNNNTKFVKMRKNNYLNNKNYIKKQNLKYSFNDKRSISNNTLNYNNKTRREYHAKYGSYDNYFFNDNNYSDNKYFKSIGGININYENLGKIKNHTFNQDEKEQISKINKILNKSKDESSYNVQEKNIKERGNIKGRLNNINIENIKNKKMSLYLDKKYNIIKEINKTFNIENNLKNNFNIKRELLLNSNINKISKENIIKKNNNKKNINKIYKFNLNILSDKSNENKENIIINDKFNNENKKFNYKLNNKNITKNNYWNDSKNKNMDNNKESINFKININNVSNYSIKNNCVNFNNGNTKKNTNENIQNKNTSIKKTFNKNEICEEKKEEIFKANHDYSNDDLFQNTDRLSTSNEKEKSDTIINININKNQIFNDNENKNIMEFCKNKLPKNDILNNSDSGEIKKHKKTILKRNKENNNESNNDSNNNNKEKNYNTINNSNGGKNYVNIIPKNNENIFKIQYNKIKNILIKDNIKKNKINHRILCHKFTDNPQNFYTVKLTESMIKQLIKMKGKKKSNFRRIRKYK